MSRTTHTVSTLVRHQNRMRTWYAKYRQESKILAKLTYARNKVLTSFLWHWETIGELDDKYFNKIVKEHVFPWLDVQQLVEYLGLRGIDCPESNSTET